MDKHKERVENMIEVISAILILYIVYVILISIATRKAHDHLYLVLCVLFIGLIMEVGGCKNTDNDYPEFEKGGTKIYYDGK